MPAEADARPPGGRARPPDRPLAVTGAAPRGLRRARPALGLRPRRRHRGRSCAAFLDALDASWAGLSLTMPLKHAVLPLLDDVDPVARRPARPTPSCSADGRRARLQHRRRRASSPRSPSAACGAAEPTATVARGGRHRPVGSSPRWRGSGRARVTAYARRPEAADDLRATAGAVGVGVELRPWADAAAGLGADVVVSTVPAGAADRLVDAVPARPGSLLDVVYDPWPTPLAAAWAARGGSGGVGSRPAAAPGGPPGRADDRPDASARRSARPALDDGRAR